MRKLRQCECETISFARKIYRASIWLHIFHFSASDIADWRHCCKLLYTCNSEIRQGLYFYRNVDAVKRKMCHELYVCCCLCVMLWFLFVSQKDLCQTNYICMCLINIISVTVPMNHWEVGSWREKVKWVQKSLHVPLTRHR